MHPILSKSSDYIQGYVDCWCGVPASKLKAEYQKGYFAAIDAKRILDEHGISTDNRRYPELAGAAR